jgi:cytochrome c oxidase subunit 2
MLLARLASALVAQPDSGGFWFPAEASQNAPQVDSIFNFILWVSAAFFALIVALMIAFVVKYRRRAGVKPEASPSHNTKLELAWSIIPGILLLFMFYFGAKAYVDLRTPPDDALEIFVTGQKWSWSFTYPNGHVDPELHVPIDQPVRLVLTSDDVIHSFFVPAFRIKMDAVPGRYTKTWFVAKESGTFQAFCAEYCGTRHSDMLAHVIVHPPGGYERWLDEASNLLAKLSPVDAGKKIYESYGCKACHTIDGTAGIGPSWKGIYGREDTFTDGTHAVAEENYLRQSIVDPQAKIVAGFAPVMPTFKGKLKDSEITAVIAFIKSLK